ncbi:lipopolysaccharide biosynthesis protein [Haloarcula sebkhae]|uniref:Lipopolysaccharide biosynthesis protein n=2 Tax=Haloarcula sebkhae TaxID=932660 RepID=A0ACC6VMR7_9EURY|nr:lipopolysaccharide biosynthesis protein [Haloarcula sebkhae]GGK72661.1 hypothetical protein GCM10009067_26150 [Haloarcula sebkhae]
MKNRLRKFLVRMLPKGDTLEQTVKSGAWMGAMNVLSRGLQILLVIILANLLDPADFGLMGIALLVLSGLRKFSKLGLNAAVIQNKEKNVDEYMNTMWVLQLVRGAVIAVVLLAVAPLIGSVFSEPRATDVVRVVAITPLFSALRNPAIVYFKKNLNFHKEFAYRMSGSVSRFVVSLGWALVSPTVWALIAGLVASRFAKFVFSYYAHDYRPWPSFELDRAKELIDYGKWITSNTILYFLYTEGDDVVVGWLLTSTALGFYQTAYRMSNAPATEISQVISSVTFPAFSTLQDDIAAMREAYYRTLQMTAFLTFPAAFGIAAIAPTFVETFMGEQWLPMVTAMQILTAYGLMRAVGKTMGPVWKAVGRPDYLTKLALLRVGLIALLIIPVTNRFGIEGTGLLITGIYIFPILPIDTYIIVKTIQGSYKRFVKQLFYPLVCSGGMFVAVVWLDQQLPLEAGVLEFATLVTTGAIVYMALVALFATRFEWAIEENLRSMFSSLS